jgi:Outer membrane protein beta-barrel domain
MKKLILSLLIFGSVIFTAKAQLLPSFQFGIKGGLNTASVSTSSSATFSSNNQAGYLGGIWARFGALGFNFQPEMYFSSKSENINGVEAKFKSIDVPLLFGGKIGALGFGARFYTGPVVSFAIDKNNGFGGALGSATAFDYKDQNFAWQVGAGLDIKAISFDLRYEAGITKQSFGTSDARLNLFSLSIAYRLAKI